MKKSRYKKKIKTPRPLYVFLLIAISLIGTLLLIALFRTAIVGSQTGENELLLRTETVYIILVLAVLLPIMVLVLIKYVSKRNAHLLLLNESLSRARTEEEISEAEEIISEELENLKDSMGEVIPMAAPAEETPPEEEADESRFYMLSEIDKQADVYVAPAYDNEITLEELCERFRHFAAGKLNLYYDISDIRRFVAGLAVTHIIIMQGMSGTGKTSLAYAFGEFMQNQSVIVPIQPMWKERTDMIGYYNEFTKRFNETVLLRKMYEANCNDNMYITVLDEMNIARVEYYFAEFLSLLELPNPEKRYLDVVSDKWETDPKRLKDGQIRLPANMWFIGTANNDDSTFAISDKVYDRAMILNLDEKSERFLAPRTKRIHLSAEEFRRLADEAMKEYEITKRNLKRLEELDRYLIDHFHITFGNRIMKQIRQYIPVYVSCGGGELEALDDILSKKIIRKLETQNPVYLRSAAEGLCVYLDELFGHDKMPLCKNAIHRLERNA